MDRGETMRTAACLALFIAGLLLLSGDPVRGSYDDSEPAAQLGSGTLSVTGYGVVTAHPDVAHLFLGAEARGDSAREALEGLARVVSRAREQFALMGAGSGDIETQLLEVYPEWDREGDGTRPRGYRAIHDLRVTVRELGEVGAWIDAGVQLGLNRVLGVAFHVERGTEFHDRAVAEAIADAQRQARAAAEAAGLSLGPVLELKVEPTLPYDMGIQRLSLPEAGLLGSEVYPSQVRFHATVTLTYSIF